MKGRRYRTLTVLDDGSGIPGSHRELVFEPGVTTRHISPVHEPGSISRSTPHGAGLSLYHIRRIALGADVTSTSKPTAVRVTFDTRSLPERALQSGSRPSRTNLEATLRGLLRDNPPGANLPSLYLASPARILATIINNRIIHKDWLPGDGRVGISEVVQFADEVGLGVSGRTVRRVLDGEISGMAPISPQVDANSGKREKATGAGKRGGPSLALQEEEVRQISAILSRSARASYLEIGQLEVRSLAGEIVLKARVFEPEEEYE